MAKKTGSRNYPKNWPELRYAREKFGSAVYYLATGEGDVRSRLRVAFLEFHPIRAEDLPVGVQKDYRWILHELTKRPESFKGEGQLDATLARMRNRTGANIARRICELNDHIRAITDPFMRE